MQSRAVERQGMEKELFCLTVFTKKTQKGNKKLSFLADLCYTAHTIAESTGQQCRGLHQYTSLPQLLVASTT